MIQIKSLSSRQAKFVAAFLANGGNGAAAARASGYATPEVDGHRLLTRDAILVVILQRLDHVPDGMAIFGNLVGRHSPAISKRVAMLIAAGADQPRVIGPADRPAVVTDGADLALRNHVLKHHHDLVGFPTRFPSTEKPPETPGAATPFGVQGTGSFIRPHHNGAENEPD